MAEEKSEAVLQIRGEDPLKAVAPIYSNFVAISRVGNDVQLEFLFIDLNQIALLLQAIKGGEATPKEVIGKTVAKLVMPGMSFLQAKPQIEEINKALREVMREAGVRE